MKFFGGSLVFSQSTFNEFNTLRLPTFNATSKIAWQYLAASIQ